MESVQDSGGLLRVDGSKGSVTSGLPSSKTVNQLKIVESGDESGKMVIPTKSEMDPYKELELYLAKVNVSLFHEKVSTIFSIFILSRKRVTILTTNEIIRSLLEY